MKNILNILAIIKGFIKDYKTIIFVVLAFLVVITVVKKCEKEPIKTETKIDIDKIKDSIREVLLREIKPVYIDTGSTKYVKGEKVTKWRDSIVYVPIKDSSNNTHTIKANIYKYDLKSNNAIAKINITSQTEPLEITGLIEYPEKTITNTITKTKNKSGLFIYANAPINTNYLQAEIGLVYQFKNTIGIMGGIEYNDMTKSSNIKVGLAVKVF